MFFRQVTDPRLAQNAYLIGCEAAGEAVLIDPERDIDRYARIAAQNNLTLVAVAETHIHADYLSGLRQCAHDWDVEVLASGEGGPDWQYNWLLNSDVKYRLLRHGDRFRIGNVELQVLHTPGHTPEHLTFLVTDLARQSEAPFALITGDFVFVGDVGRPDLLESAAGQRGTMHASARALCQSIQEFCTLDPSLLLCPGHGAGSACGRAPGSLPLSSVGYEVATNPSIAAAANPERFVDYILRDQPEPPPYFARMKRENRDGPALLASFPQPQRLTPGELTALASDTGMVILDCRPWDDYRTGHLPGALYAPLNSSFTTTVGSYVEPHMRIAALCREDEVREVVTECIRIGLDQVIAWTTPEDLGQYVDGGGSLRSVTGITMADIPADWASAGLTLLDVRSSSELALAGRIDGALHIPLTLLAAKHDELPRDVPIHIFCRTGNRSGYAVGFLERLGYNVVYVGGGFVQWTELNRLPA